MSLSHQRPMSVPVMLTTLGAFASARNDIPVRHRRLARGRSQTKFDVCVSRLLAWDASDSRSPMQAFGRVRQEDGGSIPIPTD
jgi:hypothetical protein